MCHLIAQSINVEEDWKLITLWIGGNDLCNYCKEKVRLNGTQTYTSGTTSR